MLDGADILCELVGDGAVTHGQRLPGELARALEHAKVAIEQIDLLAVVAGPGSFTGLRVGIASIQGLAFARDLKIVPVSSLEALARHVRRVTGGEAAAAPWMDAQRGEVFATLYDADLSRVLVPPSSASPPATLETVRDAIGSGQVVFAGDGAVRYAGIISQTLEARARVLHPAPPLAAEAGRIAAAHPELAVLPHAVVPIYVRRPDAELARDRSAAR